jgi:two-component system sensor histidine kinase SenX3
MEVLVVAVPLLAIVVVAWSLARFARARRRAEDSAAAARRERQELELRLRGAEDGWRLTELVVSSMREGVLLFSADGRTLFANPAVERHLGSTPSSIGALLPLGLQVSVGRALRDRAPGSAEVDTGTPTRWLRGDALPVGEEGSVLLVVRDVTEARRLDEIRRDFVANASHELKTPVATIQATAETIGTAAVDDPDVLPRFAAQLEQEALRLSRIVSDLLDLSRLESGSVLDEAVALDAIVRDEGERFEAAAAEAGVELTIAADPVPRVRGSARDLALMVRNLVDNAVRYTRPGGTVEVGLGVGNGEVVLTVRDTGVGIPLRDLPRVFERFYRVDRARSRETGGTGLGLSIVKHVVENHGGSVRVESQLGVGSTFEVRLPASS